MEPFFEGLQNYMKNENKGNENKIILEEFNCAMDNMESDSEKKTKRFFWCCSSYALSKLIVDKGLKDLWRKENPNFSESIRYDRPFGKDSEQTGSIVM